MNLIKEVNKPEIKKTIVIYGGRFQPFHRGHYDAYQRLVSKFGEANVYIASSNDTSSDKSPFTFKEKKEIATKMFGVPSSKFVRVANPYRPIEILGKFDGKTTAYIAAVGEKDADRLNGKYFKPYKEKSGYGYDEIGYTYPIPPEPNPISGTKVRKGLGSDDKEKAKTFFLKAYPKFDREIFKMITGKLNENFIKGYPSKEDIKKIQKKNDDIRAVATTDDSYVYDPISEIINKIVDEEAFQYFLRDFLKEESEAEKMGLKHLGGGYYGKDDKGPATHKSEDGKIRTLTPAEQDAANKKSMAKGPSDAPANEPKPSQPGQPVNKGATAQGKVDKAKEEPTTPKKGVETQAQEVPPEQKLGGAELKSSAEKNAEGGEESPEEKQQRENKEKLDKQIEHEKNGLSHEEKNAYEFLDGLPDEEKAKAIDDALNKRNIIQVIAQDTVVGGWLAKKGNQLKETFNGLSSFLRTGRTGAHKDCSGAPAGPHAKDGWSLGTHLAEDAESRRKYLSKLDSTGNEPDASKKPPVDKSKCKDVHYGDYQKRDENGKRVYKEEPVYESGEKPDPADVRDGAYFPGLGTGYVGPNGANVGKEKAFKANELDSKTGYFMRDGKYYDKNGTQVNEKGHTLNADGQPTQQTTLKLWPLPPKRVPKTQKSPVYEDGLSHEQEHAAHESHHKAHTQQHAIEHTVKELSAILGGAIAGPMVLSKLGLGQAAATAGTEAAHHGAAELAKHILKDGIKHAGFEMLGINTAEKAAGAGLALSAATGGLLEELCNDANMLLESNDKDANKKFFLKLLRKMAEAYKGYKMTPEQKLESLRTYKGLQYIKKQNDKKSALASLLKENLSETKQQSIQHFVEFATKRLKLKETPNVNLVGGREFAEIKTSLGGYNPDDKAIYVATEGRLTADILRTLAHEMVHRKQDELGLVKNPMKDGADGSPIENQAHAVAGILMREYGRINKQIYNEDINIDVDKGDEVLMGKFKNKKITVKDIGKDDYGMPTINGKKATTFRLGQKGQNIYEMGNKDVHLANVIKLYRNATFRKRINAYLFGRVNMPTNPNAVARALRNMGYDEITQMEKELNIQPNFDEQIAELYKDIEKYLLEVSGLVGDDAQPDGSYLPKGATRKLDANDGANKGDDWFYSGGYTQMDFPVADGIFGDEDESRLMVRYSARNLPRFDEAPTKFLKEGLLLEGGAYGHMSHPFDDMDLTFGDLKNIITKALNGELGVVREKTDGQALAISWKNGRLIAARNKGHLQNAGASAMGIEDVASKFGGRGGLTDAYNFAMKDLSAAVASLSQKQREKIFGEGSKFMNIEVIWPTSVNVIPYGQALLVFHNCIEYDIKGTAIGKVDGAESVLAGMIKQVNADVQSKYTIQGPPITEIPKSDSLSSKQGKYLSKLSKLQSEFKLSDSDNVADYHQAWWEDFINKKSPLKVDKLTKEALVRRWAFGDKSFRLNTISNPKLQEWAMENDKVNVAKQQKDNIKPFEEIFLGVGADVLEFVGSVLTVHPDKAIRSMKSRLKSVADQVKTSGNPAQIQKLKQELSRLNKLGGIDRIVANEGIVFFYNGKTYKLTGTFAPLNQILGIFYE
jgi:cytidyltransferase-like protein